MGTVTGITADHLLDLIGDVISGARVVNGERLLLSTMGGKEIDAGNIRGIEATNPTATNVSFTPASGIAATTAQAALVELAGDISTQSTKKATPSELPKILSGRVTHVSDYVSEFGGTTRTTVAYSNVFPLGYYSSPPEVIITLNSSVPEYNAAYSVTAITTRGFSINAWRADRTGSTYNWVAMG